MSAGRSAAQRAVVKVGTVKNSVGRVAAITSATRPGVGGRVGTSTVVAPTENGKGDRVAEPIGVEGGADRPEDVPLGDVEDLAGVAPGRGDEVGMAVHGQLRLPGRSRGAEPEAGRLAPRGVGRRGGRARVDGREGRVPVRAGHDGLQLGCAGLERLRRIDVESLRVDRATRARASATITATSRAGSSGLTGTGTAPMRIAPRKAATYATESSSTSATRCSGCTPSVRRPAATRSTSPSISA